MRSPDGLRPTKPRALPQSPQFFMISWLHTVGHKFSKRTDVAIDARPVECREISVAVLYADHGPRISSRRQHGIHQKSGHAPVAVRIRMDVAEHPVSQESANAGRGFLFE